VRETLRDLRADWRKWSALERVIALTLAALLAVAVPVLIAATAGVS
jgi:hypothetical protein